MDEQLLSQPHSAISTAQAKATLEQERQQRVEACRQEMAEVLQKHRCTLDVSVVLRQGQVTPQVAVLPQE